MKIYLNICVAFLIIIFGCQKTIENIGVEVDCSKYPINNYYSNYTTNENIFPEIPEHILNSFSTEELLETVLRHPYWRSIFLNSSMDISESYNAFAMEFNGIKELRLKNDFIQILCERYICQGTNKYNFDISLENDSTFLYSFIEIILTQENILNDLDDDYIQIIIETAFSNYTGSDGKSISVYSLIIMSRIMQNKQFSPFVDEIQSNHKIVNFINTANYLVLNENIINSIAENAQTYIKK